MMDTGTANKINIGLDNLSKGQDKGQKADKRDRFHAIVHYLKVDKDDGASAGRLSPMNEEEKQDQENQERITKVQIISSAALTTLFNEV